jgi:carbonic anhydrase
MRNREILRLAAGFRRFREKYFVVSSIYSRLSKSQNPKTLIIGCSDSRVDPAIISSASPGELFIVRNIANLVPPYESPSTGLHGVSAAIEFAVVNLKVENIVILGHRQCGGIRALMQGQQKKEESFVGMWMDMAHSAREKVIQKYPDRDFESQCRQCELEAIIISIGNLKGFPFVRDALSQKTLNIFGIYFDLEKGTLMEYDKNSGTFHTLKIAKLPKDLHEVID